MDTIHGPFVQLVAGTMIYQITLASGMIITNPLAFGDSSYMPLAPRVIVAEDGQILSSSQPPIPSS